MAYFDHFAQGQGTVLGNWLSNAAFRRQFNWVKRFLPRDEMVSEILEIGPGHGEFASQFLQAGFSKYDVIEPNPHLRHKVSKLGVRSAKAYLVPPFDERDSSYDLIIACDVFEHRNDAREAQLFVTEACRVLRPGGLLFILSPDAIDWSADFYNCDFSHSNPTTVRRTVELFLNEGLRVLSWKYMFSFLGGVPGYAVSRIVKALTWWTAGEALNDRFYKLRLTFLRRFLILGQKADGVGS